MHKNDPGVFRLYSNDAGELGEYAKEMTAEVWDGEKNCWTNPHERPNHFWDCEVMQKALAWQLGVRRWVIPGTEENKPVKPEQPRPEKRSVGDILATARRFR